MKSKKPVITCIDSGGPLEFVDQGITGLISEPTPESIANNLSIFINDKNKAKKYGINAFNSVKEIKWENVINKLIEPYLK